MHTPLLERACVNMCEMPWWECAALHLPEVRRRKVFVEQQTCQAHRNRHWDDANVTQDSDLAQEHD